LRVLHLSHEGLPDWRIEKSAISASRRGHEIAFGGSKQTRHFTSIFSKVYEIDWAEAAKFGIVFYWHYVKKQIKKIIRDSRPDIIHAHDIFAAKIISEFGIPFVYDDHEYTSVYVRGLAESVKLDDANYKYMLKYNSSTLGKTNKIVRKLTWNLFLKYRAVNLWSKWENEILSSSCPVIATTDKVASELRKRRHDTDRVFVVPNYPMNSECKNLEKPYFHSILSSVFAGRETLYSTGVYAHRNLDGLTHVFTNNEIGNLIMIGLDGESSAKIKYLGFLPRKSMYNEMMKHSIGLMAYRKHWSHHYKSANKAYEYAHAGLYVMCTSSFTSIIDSFNGNCAVIEDYNDLVSQLKNYIDSPDELYKKQLKSFNFARNNLVWEKYDDNIFSAYQLC
jgi:glycosyltransferase involved in cell wall biosynthesis